MAFRFVLPRKKFTQWQPLANYRFSGKDYIVFARKNLKTGMISFKTRCVNGFFMDWNCVSGCIPSGLIDVKKAWEEINSNY